MTSVSDFAPPPLSATTTTTTAMLSPASFLICCAVFLFLPLSFFLSLLTLGSPYPLLFSPSPLPPDPDPPPHFPSLDDDPLFHIASLSPSSSSPPKIAFLFLTTTPLPFAPLWDRFFPRTGNLSRLYNIYVHADPTHPYDPPFSGLFAGRVIPSHPTHRSDPSLISAARRLLAHALLHDPANSLFALLSPSCIPIRPFSFVYRTLATRSTKSFIEILSSEPSMRERYDARGPDAMLPEVPFEQFRVGSQFFGLARRHARMVVNDTALWARFRRPCENVDTCYPEEHYFPTLLSMRDPRGCVPATLTHVDWTGSVDGHPRTYEPYEVDADMILSLRSARPRYGFRFWDWAENRSDPFLFARKFSPECLEYLMNMADEVLFSE